MSDDFTPSPYMITHRTLFLMRPLEDMGYNLAAFRPLFMHQILQTTCPRTVEMIGSFLHVALTHRYEGGRYIVTPMARYG